MGIARNKFPAWPGWLVIDKTRNAPDFPPSLSILIPALKQFYKENFWDRNRQSEFIDVSLAFELFDTGSKMSVATSAKFLQRSLNLLNRNGLRYPDTLVDGICEWIPSRKIYVWLVNTYLITFVYSPLKKIIMPKTFFGKTFLKIRTFLLLYSAMKKR